MMLLHGWGFFLYQLLFCCSIDAQFRRNLFGRFQENTASQLEPRESFTRSFGSIGSSSRSPAGFPASKSVFKPFSKSRFSPVGQRTYDSLLKKDKLSVDIEVNDHDSVSKDTTNAKPSRDKVDDKQIDSVEEYVDVMLDNIITEVYGGIKRTDSKDIKDERKESNHRGIKNAIEDDLKKGRIISKVGDTDKAPAEEPITKNSDEEDVDDAKRTKEDPRIQRLKNARLSFLARKRAQFKESSKLQNKDQSTYDEDISVTKEVKIPKAISKLSTKVTKISNINFKNKEPEMVEADQAMKKDAEIKRRMGERKLSVEVESFEEDNLELLNKKVTKIPKVITALESEIIERNADNGNDAIKKEYEVLNSRNKASVESNTDYIALAERKEISEDQQNIEILDQQQEASKSTTSNPGRKLGFFSRPRDDGKQEDGLKNDVKSENDIDVKKNIVDELEVVDRKTLRRKNLFNQKDAPLNDVSSSLKEISESDEESESISKVLKVIPKVTIDLKSSSETRNPVVKDIDEKVDFKLSKKELRRQRLKKLISNTRLSFLARKTSGTPNEDIEKESKNVHAKSIVPVGSITDNSAEADLKETNNEIFDKELDMDDSLEVKDQQHEASETNVSNPGGRFGFFASPRSGDKHEDGLNIDGDSKKRKKTVVELESVDRKQSDRKGLFKRKRVNNDEISTQEGLGGDNEKELILKKLEVIPKVTLEVKSSSEVRDSTVKAIDGEKKTLRERKLKIDGANSRLSALTPKTENEYRKKSESLHASRLNSDNILNLDERREAPTVQKSRHSTKVTTKFEADSEDSKVKDPKADVISPQDYQDNIRKLVRQRPSFLQRLAHRNQGKAAEVSNHPVVKEEDVDIEKIETDTNIDETSVRTAVRNEYKTQVKQEIGKTRSKINGKSLQEHGNNDVQDSTRFNETKDDEHRKIERLENIEERIKETTIFDNVGSSTVVKKDGSSKETDFDEDEVVCPQDSLSYVIPDSNQCDKYYTCRHGQQTTELCRDGFVFSISEVKCVLHRPELCEGRTGLQPSAGKYPCIRRNGIFHSSFDCNGFVRCTDNEPVFDSCPNGLVFDPRDKICGWPDEVLREDCFPRDLLQFQCPNITQTQESQTEERLSLQFGDHSRHPDPTDCRYFFLCLSTGHPRRAGCAGGLVYSPETGVCTSPELVPGCEYYYSGAVSDQDIRSLAVVNIP